MPARQRIPFLHCLAPGWGEGMNAARSDRTQSAVDLTDART